MGVAIGPQCVTKPLSGGSCNKVSKLKFMKGNEEFEKVIRHKEDIREAVRELGKSNWPTTIVHNDLVAANIGRCGGEEGTFFFFDWGASYGRMS